MKERFSKLFVLAALSMTTILAQGPFGPGGGPPGDPAAMLQRRVDRLTALLNLTDAQKAQATTIFTNAQTASQPLQTTLATDRQSLRDAVKNNATATLDQLSSSIGTLTGQLLAIQSKADAAFYAILTTDQRSKLDQFGPGAGPWPGGGRGPRGR